MSVCKACNEKIKRFKTDPRTGEPYELCAKCCSIALRSAGTWNGKTFLDHYDPPPNPRLGEEPLFAGRREQED